MSSPQRSRSGVHTGAGGHAWVTGVGAAQDRIRAVAGRTDLVLDRLVHAVSELVDAPATVALLEDGDLVRRAATGDGRLPLGVRVETATSICGQALRVGRPVRVGDTTALVVGQPDVSCCPPGRSVLSVPLAVRGTAVGVVALTADRPDWFDGVDESTVTLVAEVAAEVLLGALPDRLTPQPTPVEQSVGLDVAGIAANASAPGLTVHDAPAAVHPQAAAVPRTRPLVVDVEAAERADAAPQVVDLGAAETRVLATVEERAGRAPVQGSGRRGERRPQPAGTAQAGQQPGRSPRTGSTPQAVLQQVLQSSHGSPHLVRPEPASRPGRPDLPGHPEHFEHTAPVGGPGFPDTVDVSDDQLPDGQLPDGQLPDGQLPDGPLPAERPAAGEAPAGGVPAVEVAVDEVAVDEPSDRETSVADVSAGSVSAGSVSAGEVSVGDLTVRRDVVPEQRTAPDAAPTSSVSIVRPAVVPSGPTGVVVTGVARPVVAPAEVSEPAAVEPEPADQPAEPPVFPALPVLGLWQWDAATGLTLLSDPAEDLAGLPAGRPRVLGAFRALVHPDDVHRVEEAVASAVGTIGPTATIACTFRLCRPDGAVRTVQLWGDLQRNRHGLVGAVGAVADVTPLTLDARPATDTRATPPAAKLLVAVPTPRDGIGGLGDVSAHLRAVRELTGAGVWSWRPGANPHEGTLEWSPEMFRLVGLEPGEITPTLAHWHGFVHDEDVDKVRRVDLGALDRSDGHGETFRVVGADGAIRHVQAWAGGVVVPDPGIAPGRVVHGAAVDVTRQVRDRVRLERLVSTDPVTGLANRAAFERRVTELLAEPGVDVALLLLDVDRFKQVNDSLGHDVGDRLLLEVARRLAAVVPEGGLVARMGGDEFVVLPRPGLGMLAVRRLAEAVTDALRMPYVLPDSGELLVCPVSLGITSTSGRAVSPQDLLAEAELALYRAKDSGRDRFVVYDEALRARSQSRLRAERLLRGALEHGRLALQYQPIVDFSTGRVVGAEALVRIRDEHSDGLLSPDVFIDVAEDTGLVVDLDRWVIETALDQVERWAAQVPAGQDAPWLSVNVSARSMEHPGAVRGLLDAVASRRVAASDIKVELTERSFLAALPGGEGALRQLLGSGIPVGIDDFGTGYSALGYLQRFELDFMKIDRSFVQSVGEDQRADAVVTAIVDLAHAHGMLVTAEGVETPRQARRLREIGCDLAQGYHFGRPADASRIVAG